MKETRSGIAPQNIQEILDAEDSAKWATLGGQQQYFTPEWLAMELAELLPMRPSKSIIDPQAGEGATITHGIGWVPGKFSCDIDNRIVYGTSHITGNCVKVFEALDELYPDMRFECFNANPPFGKRWKLKDDTVIDSTEWTWNTALKRGCYGYIISNDKTLKRLGIDKHPFVTHYKVYSDVWKNCEVVVGVAVWHNPKAEPSETHHLRTAWDRVREVIEEEKKSLPEWNIWLGQDDKLKTYLSTRTQLKHKLTRDDVLKLSRIAGAHPLTLTTERETRRLMAELIDCGFYKIQPAADKAVRDALKQVESLACPIMPVTDFEAVAYAEEEDHMVCKDSMGMAFTPGESYEFTTSSYNFTETFKRKKVHYNEETKETFSVEHDCSLSGQDRYLQIMDDDGAVHRFMDHPNKDRAYEHDEALLWKIFGKPKVKTVEDVNPQLVQQIRKVLKTCEMMAGFEYYPGQVDYMARVATKDFALVAADTGVGKSLLAITLVALKAPDRALIIAPQGTMRTSESDEEDDDNQEFRASQWVTELRRFAPYLQVFELFSYSDYERIKSINHGELPPGVYVSYYQAMFINGAREQVPDSWDDKKLAMDLDLPLIPHPDGSPDGWCHTVGMENEGIRCIVRPCLATLVGHHFDMVILDEAHMACNLSALTTQMLIRMQPKYRYALTATPIPNIVSNIFSLMGWLCVPDWHKGDIRNAAWPYAREEIGRFEGTFLTKERDYTQEAINKARNKEWNGRCEKTSPVISSPARLLKLLKPTMAYISKQACNPNLVTIKVIDVRVPMGKEQGTLYAYFLNRGNIRCKHPLIRARKQIAYLRNICADPAGFTHGGPKVCGNMNPKTIAILDLVREILARGEQVTIVCARIGQTNTIQGKLVDAGVPISRIDSTVSPESHSHQANLFKSGRTQVMLMGIKCAMGYSFPECPNLIIGSLEYSYGSKHQAEGRVYRVNSKKPVTIYCVLHSSSIEEVMFDVVATKQDAATICLHGQRMPRDFKPVDMTEVLAQAIDQFDMKSSKDEWALESHWPKLRDAIRETLTNKTGRH